MLKVLLALIFALPQLSQAAVWPTVTAWSPEMEQAYSEWVKTSWKVDVFRNPRSPYRTDQNPDCADSVYSMRIIFSYENGLPFAILDPTNGKTILSNEMKKFDGYSEGTARVHAFMNWIWDVVGTTTLPNDTYPIAVNREAFRPGALMLAKESKHSYTLKKLNENGTPVLYYSTQGNDGDLKVRSWPSVGYLFSAGVKEPSGMRYFRYPEQLRLPTWEVPGYSTEQYLIPAESWLRTVQSRLALRQETVKESLARHMSDVCQLLKTRVDLVNKALDYNRQIGDRCMNYQEFDDLSTPSRDGQANAAFNDLEVVYRAALRKNVKLPSDMAEQLRNIFARSLRDETSNQYCLIKYRSDFNAVSYQTAENVPTASGFFGALFGNQQNRYQAAMAPRSPSPATMTLGEFHRRQQSGLISSNPNDTAAVRWGDERGPSEKAARCPIY